MGDNNKRAPNKRTGEIPRKKMKRRQTIRQTQSSKLSGRIDAFSENLNTETVSIKRAQKT